MTNNLVSIIVPCYNQATYLNTTLTSVINQTHQNWECILVNDGATDNTQHIINKWVEKDNRFISISQKNRGLSNARNSGLRVAKGHFIQFLDADDFLNQNKLFLSIQQQKDIVISDFLMFNESPKNTDKAYCKLDKQVFSFESILLDWDIKYTIPIHCGFFNKKVIDNVYFNEAIKAKEDWIFWLTIFSQKPSVFFLPEKLALYRQHNNSMTQKPAFMFRNTLEAYNIIYTSILKEEKARLLFFNRIVNEYATFRMKYLDITDSKDIHQKLDDYSKLKKKYYGVWYRKFFYKFFKPKEFKTLYR